MARLLVALTMITLAGCGGTTTHALNLTFDVDPGALGASYSLYIEQNQALVRVGSGSASASFSGIDASHVWIQSAATTGVGELEKIDLVGAVTEADLAVRLPQLDASLAATMTATPGASNALTCTDAADYSYRLLALGFAFDAASRITMTPLAQPLLRFANGNGFQLSFSRAPSGTLFLEASSPSQNALLVVWDPGIQDWRPIPGSLDDNGVRTYPIDGPGLYSEVLGTPVADQPQLPWGVDQYAAFDLLKGRAADTLAWIEGNHADGSELTPDEQAMIDRAGAQMEALADAVADHACTEGADWDELKLTLASLKVSQQLGASSDYSARLDTALQRCLGQILAGGDCRAALASGDLVLVEAQRQLLGHGRTIAVALGDAQAAMEIDADIVDCTPGDPCMPLGGIPDVPTTPAGSDGTPVVVDDCSNLCESICSNTYEVWDCGDQAFIAAEQARCMSGLAALDTSNFGIYACGVAFWVQPDATPGNCQLWCEYKGFADHAFDVTCHYL